MTTNPILRKWVQFHVGAIPREPVKSSYTILWITILFISSSVAWRDVANRFWVKLYTQNYSNRYLTSQMVINFRRRKGGENFIYIIFFICVGWVWKESNDVNSDVYIHFIILSMMISCDKGFFSPSSPFCHCDRRKIRMSKKTKLSQLCVFCIGFIFLCFFL